MISRFGWLGVIVLSAALTALSTYQSLRRYENLQSGWSWDLAYYNQWFWSLTHGAGEITVRPVAAYAQEGPSIWKMNYLAPIRLAIAPFYAIAPDPRTLLVIQSVVFWWIIPAAYSLVRAESQSEIAALSAAGLVPMAPLLWPLVWNDFRELQLAAPFVLWAINGIRGRSVPLAAIGSAGMLACRQEFAVMLATFCILPPREPESLSVSLRWRRATLLGGTIWLLFGFFAYLRFAVGRGAPDAFIDQFLGPRASVAETLVTAGQALLFGLGAWAFLACLVPRVALLAVPWIWGISNGRWAMRLLATTEWHSVRYVEPMVIMVLAAGLIGYARLSTWLLKRRGRLISLILLWLAAAFVCGVGLNHVVGLLSRAPVTFDRDETREIWSWVREVGPDDAVMADYEVSAPLSSRRKLYSYILDANLPRGFPQLGPEFRWLFIRNDYPLLGRLLEQGFDVVHRGKVLTIAHRTLHD